MSYIDIHTHILPGIDDGADSSRESLKMLGIAYETGTRQIVATPHMFLHPYNNNDPSTVGEVFAEHLQYLEDQRGDYPFLNRLQVHIGSENYVSPEFMAALERGSVLPINHTRYLLVEFPTSLAAAQIDSCLKRIRERGFFPVVAHAERYWAVQQKPDRFSALVDQGCVLQVNAASLLDSGERHVYKTAWKLLRQDLAHVIASDGHRSTWRSPQLRAVATRLKSKFSHREVSLWLIENPSRILLGEGLSRS